jgi:hypothetical protein
LKAQQIWREQFEGGFVEMRARKQKNSTADTDSFIQAWRDDIVVDVFELWVGVSRLTAKVGESDGLESSKARLPAGKTAASRRPQRRKAA